MLNDLATSKQHPGLVKSERDHPFTECATFADEIKDEGMDWQTNWHFIDQPYFDQGGSEKDYPDFKPGMVKVNEALDVLTRFLKGDATTENTVYVKTIKEHFKDERD